MDIATQAIYMIHSTTQFPATNFGEIQRNKQACRIFRNNAFIKYSPIVFVDNWYIR